MITVVKPICCESDSSRNSIYHSVEGPLTYVLNGDLITEPRPLPMPPMLPPLPAHPIPSHQSQASFVSALGLEEEGSVEVEKTPEPGLVTRQPHVMACYQSYLAHYQVRLRHNTLSLNSYYYY